MTTTPQIITPLICKGCGCGYHTNLAVCPSCGLPASGRRGPVAFDEPVVFGGQINETLDFGDIH